MKIFLLRLYLFFSNFFILIFLTFSFVKNFVVEKLIFCLKKKYSIKSQSPIQLVHYSDAVVLTNELGVILDMNNKFEKLFRYKAADLIGNNCKVLMNSRVASQHDDYLKNFSVTDR